MRLAEGYASLETLRLHNAFCVGARPAGPVRLALKAGTLAGVMLLSAPAFAQEAAGDIAERIESTFQLVLGNSEELAIPLTRRALARRFSEDGQQDLEPLAYGAVETNSDATSPDETVASTDADAVEEGSAEDSEELARLPRPRPTQSDDLAAGGDDLAENGNPASENLADADPAAAEAMGGPLDLVAGAAETQIPEEFAASELAQEAVADAPPHPNPAITASIATAASESTEPVAAPADIVAAPASPSADAAGAPVLAAAGAAETPAELIASGSCLSVADVTDKDGDFKRNAELLSSNLFCIAEEKFKERRRTWTMATIKSSRPGPLFAVMHDDEDQSFDSAVEALKTYGGTLVAVETGGKRNLDGIDPNRNFSAGGIGCRKVGKNATPTFTEFFRTLFDPARPIIALHNNTGERIPTGGLGHVSMDDVPKDMEKKVAGDPDGPLAGERALVLLTEAVPVATNAETRADELNAKGINAIIETVREGKGDCSLSNYALLSGHPAYLNVTVDKGDSEKQRKIIDAILAKPDETVATQ